MLTPRSLRPTALPLPVLVREGMVPRHRALLSRPGREDGEALRSGGARRPGAGLHHEALSLAGYNQVCVCN